MKILIIDDEAELLLLWEASVKIVLEQLGYSGEIITANNGIVGLALLKQQGPFDLVITDRMMPYICGDEVVQRIRSGETEMEPKGTSRSVRIVVATADIATYDLDHPAIGNAISYCNKVSGLENFRQIVKREINKIMAQMVN